MSSMLRTVAVITVLAGLILAGFWRLTFDQQQKTIDELAALNQEMHDRLAQREAMIKRLSTSRRIAHLEVLGQTTDFTGCVTETKLLFIELDPEGTELARQTFTLPGDVVFVDALTIKFDPERVAEGHPLFGKTLVLLNRIFTDRMTPAQGFRIDTPGAVPPGYAAGEIGRFEQSLWANFWEIAGDARKARDAGVRVAQGEAVYKPLITGQTYELIVDAAGGMSLRPLDRAAENAASLTRASG